MFARIKRRLRWATNDVLSALGLGRGLAATLRVPRQRILLYHGIDRAGRKDLNGRFLSAAELDAQLRCYRDHARVVSLSDYFASRFDPDICTLALTFDDGYRNNLELALPLLEKYSLPATFFCTAVREQGFAYLWPDFLDLCARLDDMPVNIAGTVYQKKRRRGDYHHPDGRKLRDICRLAPWSFKQAMFAAFDAQGRFAAAEDLREYWEQLSVPELRQLAAAPLAEIGAHGYWHNNLAALPYAEACQELQAAQRFLARVTDQPVQALAYPDGSYSRALVNYAAGLGFTRQLVVDFHDVADTADPRLRPRLTINPFISLPNQVQAIRRGVY